MECEYWWQGNGIMWEGKLNRCILFDAKYAGKQKQEYKYILDCQVFHFFSFYFTTCKDFICYNNSEHTEHALK